MNEFKQALRTALISQFRVNAVELNDETALFSSGLIDSLSVMDLVCFVEERIHLTVPATDITLDNFDSVSRIVRYVSALTRLEEGACSG